MRDHIPHILPIIPSSLATIERNSTCFKQKMFCYVWIAAHEFRIFLEAQLLSNYIDVTVSLRHSLTGRLVLSAVFPLFVDRFGRSLRF